MNATTMTINPAQPVQPSTAGRQPDLAAADEPFNQVLSRELAQTRKDTQARENSDTRETGSARNGAEAAAESRDSAADRATTQLDSATIAVPATDPQQAISVPGTPHDLLALALPPELPKLTPGNPGKAASGQSAEPESELSATLDGRKRRTPLAQQTGQPAGAAAGKGKTATTQSAQANFQPATTAAASTNVTTTAFSGQLAAARQADALNTAEGATDPIGSPAMRVIPHAPAEIARSLAGAATTLAPSVGTSAWNQALGEKIVWMAAGAQQTASLTLNPPHLGPLQVVLQVSNDQATASFFSAQPEVRQALEAAFPRLREMLDEAGIQLGQATVSADTPHQNDGSDRQTQASARPFGGADDAGPAGLETLHAAPVRQSGRGLIDTFA